MVKVGEKKGYEVVLDNIERVWERRGGKEGLEGWHQFLALCQQSQTGIIPTGERLKRPLKIVIGRGKTFLKGGGNSWGNTFYIHSGDGMQMGRKEIILSDRDVRQRSKTGKRRCIKTVSEIHLCNWQNSLCNICCGLRSFASKLRHIPFEKLWHLHNNMTASLLTNSQLTENGTILAPLL